MLVYRMEHSRSERGPFQHLCDTRRWNGLDLGLREHYDEWRAHDITSDGHSPPCQDRSLMTYSPFAWDDRPWYCHKPTLYCGTRSFDQFVHWFPRDRWNMFDKLGMVLKIFQAEEHVFVGRYQVLFAKQTATLVEQKSLLSIEE